MKTNKYLFSVIIPIYNVDKYLKEAIDSVINQTIGFTDNIQLILVNDGSKDDSDKICTEYQQLYPKNIVYVRKENGGVSSARNEGMRHISGKYVSFLDGDDKWAEDAFEKVVDFFEKHYNEIDAVSCRFCYFEKRSGFGHALDYKYAEDTIVDLDVDYANVQMSASNLIIKTQALMGMEFDVRLKFSEDSIFVAKIILKKKKYGILSSAIYYYRKRLSSDSAIDATINNKSWYVDTLEYSYMELFNYSIKQFGEVIPYCQYQVMYDIQWRIKGKVSEVLTEEEKSDYINYIKKLLGFIDVRIIMAQKNLGAAYKLFALKLKYGVDVFSLANRDNNIFSIGKTRIYNTKAKNRLIINILEITDEYLFLEGTSNLSVIGDAYELGFLIDGNNYVSCETYHMPHKDIIAFNGDRIFKGTGFKVKIKLSYGLEIRFVLKEKRTDKLIGLKPHFGRMAKLSHIIKSSYYADDKYIIKFRKEQFFVTNNVWYEHFKSECRLIKNIVKNKEYGIALYRIGVHLINYFKKKDIWILSDRTDMARDNGKALFSYIVRLNSNNDKKVFFAIDRTSDDFKFIKNIGKVLKLDSFAYKLNFLCADKIISAHADHWVTDAFGDKIEYVKDLYKFSFIFLQHGIIQNDLSGWLNKQNKNIKLFVTSTEAEWTSIVHGNYGYGEAEVKLTGLPRYDMLTDGRENKVLILPTWRKDISNPVKKGTSERDYVEYFKKTDYYRFFNSLINDDRIILAMKQNGYTGEFYVHPSFDAQLVDFEGNETISVNSAPDDYGKLFSQGAALVTDYSSIAFDFAYMKKPVVYSQYDIDTIYKTHTSEKGYFNYETDGFGPVCYNYEETISAILDCIKHGCKMGIEYEQRVDNFFRFNDKNNCKRVYEEILKM